jgi:hypothetical protein
MKMQSFARRYCLLAYWLVFVLLTLYYAQYHGLISHPERWRYPWGAVVEVWALLAILIRAEEHQMERAAALELYETLVAANPRVERKGATHAVYLAEWLYVQRHA